MKLATSNIAWTKEENVEILEILEKYNIRYLEYAPKVLKNNHLNITYKDIKKIYLKKKIKLYSMQSILYNKKNHFIFGNKLNKKNLYNEVVKKIKLAKTLGSKVIVFGSPAVKKNIYNKDKNEMFNEAVSFFRGLIKVLNKYKITICIEGNPKIYGGDYILDTHTAIKIVNKLKFKYIKVNLDIGTIIQNKENYRDIITKNLSKIGHVQLSVPRLKSINYKISLMLKILNFLEIKGYNKVVSIEQLGNKKNNTKKIKLIAKVISSKFI